MIRSRTYSKGRADRVWMWGVRDRRIGALSWALSLSSQVNGGGICSDGEHQGGKSCWGRGDAFLDIEVVLLRGR